MERPLKMCLPTKMVSVFFFALTLVFRIVGTSTATLIELFYDDNGWNFGLGTAPVGGGAVLFTPPITPLILTSIAVGQ